MLNLEYLRAKLRVTATLTHKTPVHTDDLAFMCSLKENIRDNYEIKLNFQVYKSNIEQTVKLCQKNSFVAALFSTIFTIFNKQYSLNLRKQKVNYKL